MDFVNFKKTTLFFAAISLFSIIQAEGSDSRFNKDPNAPTSSCDCDCGLLLSNFGGINHDEETNNYWTHPLIVSSSNSEFDTVSCIRLKGNVIYKPSITTCSGTENLAAIIIDKDNITLDISGFTLSLDSSNFSDAAFPKSSNCPAETGCTTPTGCTPEIHGILLKAGVKNFQIISSTENRYGSIRGFTGFGIKVTGELGNNVKNISASDIRIFDCSQGGVSLNYVLTVDMTRIETNNNCAFNPVYGMKFINVTDLTIIDSKSKSNYSCNNVYGIYLEDTINSSLLNVESSGNISYGTAGDGSSYGIYCTARTSESSYNNSFKKCIASSNICADLTSAEAAGIVLCSTDSGDHEGTSHNTIEECTASSNNFPETTSPPSAFGIKIDHSNFNKIVKNTVGCNGTRTTSPSSPSYGIIDTLKVATQPVVGSTSYFMQNFSYFNGHLGDKNYSVEFKMNESELESFKSIIIYPNEYEPLVTAHPMANIELRKS